TAAEAVVVTVHDGPSSQHLEAFELDGRPRWQQPAPATYSLAALGDEIWLATTIAEVATLHAVAWRIDARDGQAQQVPLDLGGSRFLGPYVATEHGLFVLAISAASYGPAKHLVSLTLDGRRRWDREVVPAWDDAAAASWQLDASRAGFDGRDPWVLGFETRTDSFDAEDPQWDYRVALQRWSADGTHQDTLRPSPEQLGDPADVPHSACLPSDVARGSRVGSGVARPDGPLIVAGRRGCRDSFVLGMTVER
ncbi:MAG: hypothetical protein KDK70_43070, partial [Myxococcales bacterium]|nr:hypothetical protein [Myxococcales bacterium]